MRSSDRVSPNKSNVIQNILETLYVGNGSNDSSIYDLLALHTKPIRIDPQWVDYRLGDMVRYDGVRRQPKGYKLHKIDYPQSIATEYMDTTETRANFSILSEIIDKRMINKSHLIPADKTLVVHLRTGDIIDLSSYSVMQFLNGTVGSNGGTKAQRIKSLKYFEQKLEIIHSQNIDIDHVLLVTGFHDPPNFSHHKSFVYIDGVYRLFIDYDYNVSLRLNENPDDDILLLANSKYFIQSGAGFSWLMANMVAMRNNTVIGGVVHDH